jgi:hypothetical protein
LNLKNGSASPGAVRGAHEPSESSLTAWRATEALLALLHAAACWAICLTWAHCASVPFTWSSTWSTARAMWSGEP